MWNKQLIILITTFSLTACIGSKPIDLKGSYALRVGNDCEVDKNNNNQNDIFLEIRKVSDEGKYKARLPIAAAQNLPSLSEESSIVDDELSFTFFEKGKTGLLGGSPSTEMLLDIVPNKEIENHIIITRLLVTALYNGQSKQMDFLDMMFKKEPNSVYKNDDITGICLQKIN